MSFQELIDFKLMQCKRVENGNKIFPTVYTNNHSVGWGGGGVVCLNILNGYSQVKLFNVVLFSTQIF